MTTTPAKPPRRRPAETATSRLTRLLTMVPWLVNRQGIAITEAAAGLGVSEQQLVDDLNLVLMCGYGSMHDEMIDVQMDSGHIYLSNAETIARPRHLGVDEALSLMVGLRALLAVPGDDSRDAIERALAKLEEAAGSLADAAARVDVAPDGAVDEGRLAAARDALTRQRRIRMVYLVPSRDEATERDVDPMRLVSLDGHQYLEGWCHRAQDTRLFRLDRVQSLEVLDVEGVPPEGAPRRDLSRGGFTAHADDALVTVHLQPAAAWVAEYYPVESRVDTPDGSVTVTLRSSSTGWLVRLMTRLGGRAEVVAPPEVRREVAAAAADALDAYERG
ncbi:MULTISPECIES: helix-turn-helix transcriptional regulator [unclassified Janibacter]|uniref:helix-turn-helix transcriptional regulator n=1 Tax=unclassified Janibacter TaxID=2649294 RepID=UPI003D08E4DE